MKKIIIALTLAAAVASCSNNNKTDMNLTQEWDKEPVALTPGTVIVVPEGVKHWHGAAADSWMQHLVHNANVTGKNPGEEWLEPVTDEVYKLAK